MTQNVMKCHFESFLWVENFEGRGPILVPHSVIFHFSKILRFIYNYNWNIGFLLTGIKLFEAGRICWFYYQINIPPIFSQPPASYFHSYMAKGKTVSLIHPVCDICNNRANPCKIHTNFSILLLVFGIIRCALPKSSRYLWNMSFLTLQMHLLLLQKYVISTIIHQYSYFEKSTHSIYFMKTTTN